ncbi:MAG: hypothetical protein HOP09_02485 [Hyphomicrobium sp.]|nr:hypothetical protein [Hyphomicrobium sp.]
MKDVLTFLTQLGLAGAIVWLLVWAIKSYFHKRAERTGATGRLHVRKAMLSRPFRFTSSLQQRIAAGSPQGCRKAQ